MSSYLCFHNSPREAMIWVGKVCYIIPLILSRANANESHFTLQEHLERFTHILVDSVLTKHQSSDPIHVLFIGTRSGTIKKLSYNPRSQQACVVEILHPFAKGRSVTINTMKLLSYSNAIYMATEENVIRLPVNRCQRFRTQRACLNAMDPYCGWNQQTNECTATPNNNPRAGYWQQSLLTCPIMSDPVSNALKLSNDF